MDEPMTGLQADMVSLTESLKRYRTEGKTLSAPEVNDLLMLQVELLQALRRVWQQVITEPCEER